MGEEPIWRKQQRVPKQPSPWKWLIAAIILALATVIILAIGVFTSVHAGERTTTTYDASGRLVERGYSSHGQTTTYDASGRLTSRSYTSGATTTTYDASGRLIERTTRKP